MVDIPQFLRFVNVELYVDRKCNSVVNYLQPLKKSLNGSNLITFEARINENIQSGFSNHLQLLNHIQEELMPIFDSSHGYKFKVHFDSDANAGVNVIRQLLQMHPIDRCSNVEITLYGLEEQPNQLPLEAISNFLHRNRKCGRIRQDSNEIYLRIKMAEIQNVHATCDHFKKVIKYFSFNLNFWKP